MPANPFNTHCPDWATALLGGALLGGVAGLLTAQQRGYAKADRQAGLFSYNGVLLGLLLNLYFPWSALLPPLIIVVGGLSAMLTQQWLKRAAHHYYLPVYTAPFVGLGWLLLAFAAPQLQTPSPDMNTLNLLAALFKGLGQVMFLSHPVAGALIAVGLLIADRRAFFWALSGSAAGLGFSLLQHETSGVLLGLGSYNPVLAALAFSQQRHQPWLPLPGIVLAVVLTPVLATLGLTTLTAPFILACWLVGAGVRLARPPCKTLENHPRLR